MTIKELYEEAVRNGIENYEIKLQYQDDGGIYQGSCSMSSYECNVDENEITLS